MKNKLLELEAKDLNISNISNIKKIYQDRKIKKILLIQPPDTNAASFNYSAGKRVRLYNYPPYGLGLLATQIRKLDLEVDILNLNYEILKQCVNSDNEGSFNFDQIWKDCLEKKT